MNGSIMRAALRSARVLSIAFVSVGLVFLLRPVDTLHAQGKTLVVAAVTTPKGLDPDFWVPGMIESIVNVYEGLTRYGRSTDENGREFVDANVILPHLAESWTVSDDGKVYEFKLREGVRSVYGNEMTSADVVWGWEKSVPQKRTGRFLRTVASVESVEAVDKYRVRFNLSAANRIFLKVLTLYSPSTYDSTEVKKHITDDDPWALEWISKNTAGFGAYHMESLRAGEGAVFVANPNYIFEQPYFTRVVFREVPSAAARTTLIKSGEVQWAEQIPIQQVRELMDDPNVKVESVPGTGPAILPINANYEPFNDIRVRKALIHATDFDAINEAVFLGLGTRSRSFLPPLLPGHKEVYMYEHDIAKAKQFLAEAGYSDGLELTLEYSSFWWWEEALAVQVKDSVAAAGITLNLKRIPATDMLTRRGPGERTLPFFTYLTTPFVLDPGYAFLLSAHSKGSNNVNAYITEELDALIDAIVVEQDDEKWLEMIAKAQKMIADDATMIATFFPGVHAVMAPCISGWVFRPVPYTYWRDLKCEG